MKTRPLWILPIIVVAQFAGGSLWFSGNAILNDLIREWSISEHSLSYITSAVQLGFIAGSLLFAYFTVSDRYSPRKIFFLCSFLGAVSNGLVLFIPGKLIYLIVLRFTTGFFLAGIYPVGMKIASGWYQKGLGKALGFLVGALVLGTAFPHALKALEFHASWKSVLVTTSIISFAGGMAMLKFVPDGPYIKNNIAFDKNAIFTLFKAGNLRSAAMGYFGHMWELYTLWAFTPFILNVYLARNPSLNLNLPLWSFLIIASGFIGCSVGGLISKKSSSESVAFYQLAVSGLCCLMSPFLFNLSPFFFLAVMIVWGISVVGDSPQYSAVIAKEAPADLVGSALTLVNSIGFLITVISIQFMDLMSVWIPADKLFLILLPGPLIGLYSMKSLVFTSK